MLVLIARLAAQSDTLPAISTKQNNKQEEQQRLYLTCGSGFASSGCLRTAGRWPDISEQFRSPAHLTLSQLVVKVVSYGQLTMDGCSTRTNAAGASLNVTFGSGCRFSCGILHLLYCESIQITLWCILGTLRIIMGRSTPSAETHPREGKKF